MALNPKILEEGLIRMSDNAAANASVTYADFVTAVEQYAYGLQYPPPVGVAAAAGLLKNLLNTIPTNPPLPIAAPIMKAALQLFAVGVAMGKPINGTPAPINPSPGVGSGVFPTIPPPGQPAIDSILAQPNDKKVLAAKLANAIHAWFITGQYDGLGFVAPGPGTPPPPLPTPGPTPWM